MQQLWQAKTLLKGPAKDSICRKCNRKGHYGIKCYSKSVGRISTDDTALLGSVHANQDNSWVVTLSLEGMSVPFKLDTGAEVTVISGKTYSNLGKPSLQEASRILYGPARRALNVRGQFTTMISYKGQSTEQTVFVAQDLKTNLLGLPVIDGLRLLSKTFAIRTEDKIRGQFPQVFTSLGTMGEEYVIKLKEGAVPFALYTSRNVSFPL